MLLLSFVSSTLITTLLAAGHSNHNSSAGSFCPQLLQTRFPQLSSRLGDRVNLSWICQQIESWQSEAETDQSQSPSLSSRQNDWLYHLHTCRGSSCFVQDDNLDLSIGATDSTSDDFLDFDEEESSATGANEAEEPQGNSLDILNVVQIAQKLVGEPIDSEGVEELNSPSPIKISRAQMATLCARLLRITAEPLDLVDRILHSWQSVDNGIRETFRHWKRKCRQLVTQLRTDGKSWRTFVSEAGDYTVVEEPNATSIPGGFSKAVRKEYRRMSEEERERFNRAFGALRMETVEGRSKLEIIASSYSPTVAPEAHWGPAYWPFQREFLKQVELALRNEDQDVSLPYWDTSIDAELPNPKDSIIWTPNLLGSAIGDVTDGPFSSWNLTRNNQTSWRLFNRSDFAYVMRQSGFGQLTFCEDPTVEVLMHLSSRFISAGDVQPLLDPAHYMLMSYADYIWEKFRQIRQTEHQRQWDYPLVVSDSFSICKSYHEAEALMSPFQIQNQMGMSPVYLNEFYSYAESPDCNDTQSDCHSEFLFCYTLKSRCVAKIRLNGNCSGFDGFPACFNGVCVNGKCLSPGGDHTDSSNTVESSSVDSSLYNNRVIYDANPLSTPSTTDSSHMSTTTAVELGTDLPNLIPIISSRESEEQEVVDAKLTTMASPIPSSSSSDAMRIDAVVPLVKSVPPPINTSSVWFTVSVVKGNGHFRVPVRGATIRTKGLNVPPGFTEELEGKILSGQYSYPYYIGAAVAQVRDPSHVYPGIIEFNVTVTNDKGVKCRPTCFSRPKYVDCPGRLRLSRNSYYSDPIQFKPTIKEALETMWTVANFRTRIPDFILFQCP